VKKIVKDKSLTSSSSVQEFDQEHEHEHDVSIRHSRFFNASLQNSITPPPPPSRISVLTFESPKE
jgi:hypothetical protein